jgi:hypothetical protein
VTEIWLNEAVVVAPDRLAGPEAKAVAMLVEEVAKRTQVRWATASAWPAEPRPVVAVGSVERVQEWAGLHAATLAAEREVPGREFRARVRRLRCSSPAATRGECSSVWGDCCGRCECGEGASGCRQH